MRRSATRKPVPSLAVDDITHDSRRDAGDSTTQLPISDPVNHRIKRYTLSEAPLTTGSASLTFNAIDEAITRMQNRGEIHDKDDIGPSEPREQSPIRMSTPVRPGARSVSRHDSSSSATLTEPQPRYDIHTFKNNSDTTIDIAMPVVSDYPPVLPTITSEEVLDWDNFNADRSNGLSNSSFNGADRVQPPVGSDPINSLLPERPPSTHFTSDSLSRSQTPYEYYSYHEDPHSRPSTAYHSYDASQSQLPPEYYSSYPQPQPMPIIGYPDHQDGAHPSQAHLQQQVEPIIDHFQHDAEAYTSGTYSRASFRPTRSRSATPAGDDEFYVVAADQTLDYNDGSYGVEKGNPEYDDEAHAQYLHVGGNSFVGEKSPLSEYPGTPVTTRHFGPAPTGRVARRHKTKKRVQLTNGNLVLDINVPTKLVLPRRGESETTKTRYTAVTCDPDDFEKNNFFLRQNESGRRTELFIVITMYNEDEVLFCRTLHGVMRNISHLCTRKNSQTWGQDAWKKVVVCIVADGRKKIHPRVLDCLAVLGVYQEGDFMKNLVNNKPVTAHLFEYTTSFALDDNLHFRYPDKGIVPTQILFCLKEKNQKKINSHRWFFNAFAPLLQPNVCILLDVGTRPSHKSLYRLWKTFDLNSNVGGACGEIAAYKGRRWVELLNPLVASQNFEYKMSNILDKPTESLFGYISVLPGAFSAYRYIALQNNKSGEGPLASYFKGEVIHGRETDIFTSNMYLAEDRILCFELVAKANADWVLRYVKGAIGETDVPDTLAEFISQRRRWLNGSFFAAVYAIAHTAQILRSGHSTGRKAALVAETFYNIINLTFSWFAIGNFYLFFIILTSSLEDPSFGLTWIKYPNTIIQYAYASIVVACFLFSLGNKPKASPWKYKLSAIFFAILNIYTIICAVVAAIHAARQGGGVYHAMLLSTVATYGVYVFSSILALDPWHLLTSFGQYLLLSPTFINILNIYAFSNLDDISWGTKQDNVIDTDLGAVIQDKHSQVDVELLTEPADVNQMYDEALDHLKMRKSITKAHFRPSEAEKEQLAKDYYANVRTNVLLLWVLSNGVLVLAILSGGGAADTFSTDNDGQTRTRIYLTFILAFVAITSFIRFVGSTTYLLTHLFTG